MTTSPTNNQIDQLLAEKAMGWYLSPNGVNWCYDGNPIRGRERWSPTTNRDDLADVLRKLTPEQWDSVIDRLGYIHMAATGCEERFSLWLLTCDPAIIARAVAEVVR